MAEETRASGTAVQSRAPRERRKKSHPWAFPLGLLILALAVIGAVSLLAWGSGGIKNLVDDTEKKNEYQAFLAPVVMYDPDPFDDISQADMGQLLDAAIWSLLRSDLAPDQYISDGASMQVPQADVDVQFARLFGTDIKPLHATVEGYGYQFAYDEAGQFYKIPLTGVEPAYTPRVEKIQKKGSAILLTVGYISSNQWKQDADGNMVAVQADKYMKVTLRVKDDSYYISAIQATDAPETAKSTAPSTTAPPAQTQTETETEPPAQDETQDVPSSEGTAETETLAAPASE